MKFKLAIILVLVILLTGCQVKNSYSTLEAETDVLREWLPDHVGYTNYFVVPTNARAYETLLKIEQSPDQDVQTFWYEGEGITGIDMRIDGGHYRKLQLAKDFLYESIDEREIILLRTPLKEKETWQTPLWLPEIGWTNGVATIDSHSDDQLVVTVKGTTVDAIWTYTIKKNMGIIKSKVVIQGKSRTIDFLVSHNLPPKSFVSRYVMPSELVSSFYKEDPRVYTTTFINFQDDINRVPEESLHILYDQTLDEQDKKDLRTIALAADMANEMMLSAKEDTKILSLFISYYEEVIALNKSDFETALGFDRLAQLFYYDEAKGFFKVKESNDILEPELRAIGQVFVENGIGIDYGQEFTTLQAQPEFLSNAIAGSDSANQLFILLKEWQYKHAGKIPGDRHVLNWNDLADHIVELERFVLTYPDYPLIKEMQQQLSASRTMYLAPVTEEISQRKFNNGLLQEGIKDSYEYCLQNHLGTELFNDVVGIYAQLKSDAWIWTKAYEKRVMSLGIQPRSVAFDSGYNEHAIKQLAQFRLLIKNQAVDSSSNEVIQQPEEVEKIVVSSGEELLKAIGSNRIIYLKPGIYDLNTEITTPNVRYDFGQLVIHHVENLTLQSENAGLFVHLLSNVEGTVIKFDSSKNIILKQLRITRANTGAQTPLMGIQHSSDVHIDKCIFAGPSGRGIELRYTDNIVITESQFYDIDHVTFTMDNVKDLTVKDSFVSYVGATVLSAYKSENMVFDLVEFLAANKVDSHDTVMFELNKSSLELINNLFEDNTFSPSIDQDGLKIIGDEE
ncbi:MULTISPECIES: right-handed parallel beta-helix repeat-containing protein [unclassified Fusibacter]|uniref:right-handed parallel beta-helix repeat-containing protein n=1 Tax=unclassified Fusibacter TaxID=2624464 RepID=UPI00101040F1|nr:MULTISPECIES: right-handed parallel beta-helix repeat-containing protein [unclassified Fusibacter]MCK8059342.1 right-handed parallel beta-helix repeat-containing protein [Fusibacter sp. A2]NPE21194.1 right-handed parallel beta-helix repeat-containing protein [Fusibacter sp. A1]RXV62462.1 right-handed parallel beta-helix repeat-containing protein [Fusibacter sp. A1]